MCREVHHISRNGTTAILFQVLDFFPWLKNILLMLFSEKMKKYRDAHLRSSKDKMRRRIQLQGTRPDFIEGLLQKREELVSY